MKIKVTERDMIDSGCMNKGFPVLHKKGIVGTGSECTPFLFGGKLYRVESMDDKHCTSPIETRKHSYARIFDVESGEIISKFGFGHYFFDAYAEGDKVYVFGTLNNAFDGWMGGDTVTVFESTDLVNWTEREFFKKEGWIFYNHSVTRDEDGYAITVEVAKPDEVAGEHPFTYIFAKSKDLVNIEFLDYGISYPQDRYSGGSKMHYVNGYYYFATLVVIPGSVYVFYISRTKDFLNWQLGKYNPFLQVTNEDRTVSPDAKGITDEMRERIKTGYFCSASDLDFCEVDGKTILNYNVGNQRGLGFLAEAVYDGTVTQMLENFFD